jgi:hypothetical protein
MEGILIAYEFYTRDETGNVHLIGILPERRKDMERISDKSIMNWIKKILGHVHLENDIFFNQVKIE